MKTMNPLAVIDPVKLLGSAQSKLITGARKHYLTDCSPLIQQRITPTQANEGVPQNNENPPQTNTP
jgi:hypothetical protein